MRDSVLEKPYIPTVPPTAGPIPPLPPVNKPEPEDEDDEEPEKLIEEIRLLCVVADRALRAGSDQLAGLAGADIARRGQRLRELLS